MNLFSIQQTANKIKYKVKSDITWRRQVLQKTLNKYNKINKFKLWIFLYLFLYNVLNFSLVTDSEIKLVKMLLATSPVQLLLVSVPTSLASPLSPSPLLSILFHLVPVSLIERDQLGRTKKSWHHDLNNSCERD